MTTRKRRNRRDNNQTLPINTRGGRTDTQKQGETRNGGVGTRPEAAAAEQE